MGKKKGKKNKGYSLGDDDFEASYTYDADDGYSDYEKSSKKNKRSKHRNSYDGYDEGDYDGYDTDDEDEQYEEEEYEEEQYEDEEYEDEQYEEEWDEESEEEDEYDDENDDEESDDPDDEDEDEEERYRNWGKPDSSSNASVSSNSSVTSKPVSSASSGFTPRSATLSTGSAQSSDGLREKKPSPYADLRARVATPNSSDTVSSSVFKAAGTVSSQPAYNASRASDSKRNGTSNNANSAKSQTDSKTSSKHEDVPDDEVYDYGESSSKGGRWSNLFKRAKKEGKEDDLQESEEAKLELQIRREELEEKIKKVKKELDDIQVLREDSGETDGKDPFEDDEAKLLKQLDEYESELRTLNGGTISALLKKLSPIAVMGAVAAPLKSVRSAVAKPFERLRNRRVSEDDESQEDEVDARKNQSKSSANKSLRRSDVADADSDAENAPYGEPSRNWTKIAYKTVGFVIVGTLVMAMGYVGYLFMTGKNAVKSGDAEVAANVNESKAPGGKGGILWKRSDDKKTQKNGDLSEKIAEVGKKASNNLDEALKSAQEVGESIGDSLMAQNDALKNNLAEMGNELSESASSALDDLKDTVEDVKTSVSSAVDNAYESASDVANNFVDNAIGPEQNVANGENFSDPLIGEPVEDGSKNEEIASEPVFTAPSSFANDSLEVEPEVIDVNPSKDEFDFGDAAVRNPVAATPPTADEAAETLNVDVASESANETLPESPSTQASVLPSEDLVGADWENEKSAVDESFSAAQLDPVDTQDATTLDVDSSSVSLDPVLDLDNSSVVSEPPLDNSTPNSDLPSPSDSDPSLNETLASAPLSGTTANDSTPLEISSPSLVSSSLTPVADDKLNSTSAPSSLKGSSLTESNLTLDDSNDATRGSGLADSLSNSSGTYSAPALATQGNDDDLDLTLGGTSNAVLDLDETSDLNSLSGAAPSPLSDDGWTGNAVDGTTGSLVSGDVASVPSLNNGGLPSGKNSRSLGDALANLNSQAEELGNQISEKTQSLQEGARRRLDSLNESIDQGVSNLQELQNKATDGINSLSSSVSNSISGAMDSAREGYDELTGSLNNAYDSTVNSLGNAYNSTVDSLNAAGNNIRNSVQELQNNLANAAPLSGNESNLDGLKTTSPSLKVDNSVLNETSPAKGASVPSLNDGTSGLFSDSVLDQNPSAIPSLATTTPSTAPALDSTAPSSTSLATTTPSTAPALGSTVPSSTPLATTTPSTAPALGSTAPSSTPLATTTPSTAPSSTPTPLATTTPAVSTASSPLATAIPFGTATSLPASTSPTSSNPRPSQIPANNPSANNVVASNAIVQPQTSYPTSPSATYSTNATPYASNVAYPTGLAAVPNAANTRTPTSQTNAAPNGYRVYITKEGDNLLTIAENELGSSSRWGEIRSLNNLRSGSTYFNVGTRLIIPSLSDANE